MPVAKHYVWTPNPASNADVLGLRIRRDSTQFNFEISIDGTNWSIVFQIATGSLFVPQAAINKGGFFGNPTNDSVAMTALAWSVT